MTSRRGQNERLEGARAGVNEACSLLLHPSAANLDRCRPALERAIGCLEEMNRSVPPAGSAGRLELASSCRNLRGELDRLMRLMSSAAAYYQALDSSLDRGYTESGQLAGMTPVHPLRGLSLEG